MSSSAVYARYQEISMNLSTEKINGLLVLHVKEVRVDAHNSEELKKQILQYLENGQINLVIDLAEVQFIDSSGLGALLSGYKNTTIKQGNLVLTGLQNQVQSMFELTRLHRIFEIYPGVKEALINSEKTDHV